jgi:hypothetical protein
MLLNTPLAFDQKRSADGCFFPLSVAVIWIVKLTGFVPDIFRRFASGKPKYPLAIHIHAAAFVGWL